MTDQWKETVSILFAQARADLEAGRLSLESLDMLQNWVLDGTRQMRQRLLYLHTAMPSVRSSVIAAALHEPIADAITQIDPLAPELPYQTVIDAIREGWRIIHFPDQRAPFDDREIDMVGYEFILEKWEVFDAG